jgi:hypothetical protein
MIKKLLSAVLLITSVGVTSSSAQCTPNVSCAGSADYGICPDSATGIPAGTVGVAYSTILSIKAPATAAHWGQPAATIDSLVMTGVDGLAPGLSYHCVPANCSFVGGQNGCILISGTPTAVWNHIITVHIKACVAFNGSHFCDPTDHSNTQYRSKVNLPAGIESLDLTKFDVEQNAPNPFGDRSEIHFTSVNNTEVEFRVYDLLGAVVYVNKFKASKGVNTITIEANSFSSGVYMYSVKNGDTTITKRMVVSSK